MDKEKYCILENDGVGLCVCKHRPCEQLKQLQADYDDLHLTYAGCKTANTGLQELNEKLQAENERLKEEITKLSDPRYQISKVNEGYYNRMKTYKQALQEIKDIADRTDGNHPASVINMVSVIRYTINSVIGVE